MSLKIDRFFFLIDVHTSHILLSTALARISRTTLNNSNANKHF